MMSVRPIGERRKKNLMQDDGQSDRTGQVSLCRIWGAGQYFGEETARGEQALVIAADGGLEPALEHGDEPDLIVGDFDSLPAGSRKLRTDIPRRVLPAEKDDTDLLAAVKIGWQRGYRRFLIYGGLGGRMDHTLANLNLIHLIAASGGRAELWGQGMLVTALGPGSLDFPAWDCPPRSMVSVLAADDQALGVVEQGLKYQTDGMTMTNQQVTGVSNEFLPSRPAHIALKQGTVFVTYPTSAPEPVWSTSLEPKADLGPLETRPSRRLA